MAVLVDPMIGGGAASGGLEKADATCCSTVPRDSTRYRNSLGLRRGTSTGMWQLIGYAAAAAARWSSLELQFLNSRIQEGPPLHVIIMQVAVPKAQLQVWFFVISLQLLQLLHINSLPRSFRRIAMSLISLPESCGNSLLIKQLLCRRRHLVSFHCMHSRNSGTVLLQITSNLLQTRRCLNHQLRERRRTKSLLKD
jgi:hypothetical protein